MKKIQPKLKLKHAKVIRPTTRKVFTTKGDKKTGELIREEAGTEVREYREYRETRSDIKGVITPRKIQMYRWWFRYLQLALELEQLDFTFTEHRRVKGTKNTKGYDKAYNHKVVVNRNKYEGWDLDEVLNSTFDKWWKGHSHLFVETLTQTVELSPLDEIVAHDHYRYFRVDTRMTTGSIVRSLREQLGKKRRATKWTSQWTPTGEYRQEKLFNCYNALVMWLQGKTTKEILSSGLFRKSRASANIKGEITYVEDQGARGDTRSRSSKGQMFLSGRQTTAKDNMDKMKDLLGPGRRLVLIAADGYFAKHPRNKKYFGK